MPSWQIKMLYDGHCPLCQAEVDWLKRRDRHSKLAFEDITHTGFKATDYGTTQAELMRVIHAVTPDGRVFKAMDAIRRTYGLVGSAWLLAPTGWPLIRPLVDRLYLHFARNRLRWSKILGRNVCTSTSCQRNGH